MSVVRFGALQSSLFIGAHEKLQEVGLADSIEALSFNSVQYMVKMFLPDTVAKWIVIKADTRDSEILYGIADLGLGVVEYGAVSLRDLRAIRGPLGCEVQYDYLLKLEFSFGDIFEHCTQSGRIIY